MRTEVSCVYRKGKELRNELKRNIRTFLVFIFLDIIVLLLGTFLFFYIEHCVSPVQTTINPVQKAYNDICVLVNSTTTTSQPYNDTEGLLLQDNIKRICNETGRVGDTPQRIKCDLDKRNFAKWFSYSITVAFTIGYGHVVPASTLGKIVTMIYALPAIGVTVTMYSYAGKFINTVTKLFFVYLEIHLLKHKRIHNCSAKAFGGQIFFALSSLLILGGLITYTEREMALSFSDSLYYGFITLTTIGFGDIYIPPERLMEEPWVFVIRLLVFFMGMGAVASAITGLSDMMMANKVELCPKSQQIDVKHSEEKLDKQDSPERVT